MTALPTSRSEEPLRFNGELAAFVEEARAAAPAS
jgi:hypothetical protein